MSYAARLSFCLALLLLPATHGAAQEVAATLAGAVTDAATGKALPDVNVFIAVSMNGSVTDAQGRYRLVGVPLGTLRLYVSRVGYEPQFRDLFIREAKLHTFDFQLKEAIIEVGQITVTGEEDPRWRRRLERFTELFIGETPNAAQTKIVNPEVLDFTSKGGDFRAVASAPLVIENQALGYRIQYFLKDFSATPTRTKYDGEPLYEEMSPESPEQAALWKARRDSAFYGSFRHFMLALLNDRLEEQGFQIFSRPAARGPNGVGSQNILQGNQRYPIQRKDILKDGDGPDQKILDFHGFVEILYAREEESRAFLRWSNRPPGSRPRAQSSMIQVEKGPTVVDLKGDVLDPYGVTFYGYLAFERVGDELPKEYRPWH